MWDWLLRALRIRRSRPLSPAITEQILHDTYMKSINEQVHRQNVMMDRIDRERRNREASVVKRNRQTR